MSRPKERTSISVDPDVLAYAEQEVAAGRARSVSAVVEDAVRARMTRRARLREWLDSELTAASERDPIAYAESRRRVAALFGLEPDDSTALRGRSA